MKAVILIITLILNATAAFAGVENYLPNIRDRVRQCTVLPYEMQNNIRREKALQSHCPEVKVLPVVDRKAVAKIRVNGHQFMATLIETEFTDGDFFDVEIRDLSSNDSYRIYNAPAYGDVLLGVLAGNTQGIHSIITE